MPSRAATPTAMARVLSLRPAGRPDQPLCAALANQGTPHPGVHGRISHAGNIPSVTTRDRHSRHRAVRDAKTAQVAVTGDQDAAGAEKVTAVLIKRCRTVLTEHCCYITK